MLKSATSVWEIKITKVVFLSPISFVTDDADPDPPQGSDPGGGRALPRPPPDCDDDDSRRYQLEIVMTMTEKQTSSDKVRVQLDFNPQQMARLLSLMGECGLETRKDLINHALTLFGWAVGEIRTGRVIGSLDKATKEFTVVSMPGLALVAPRAAPSLVAVEGKKPANEPPQPSDTRPVQRNLSAIDA